MGGFLRYWGVLSINDLAEGFLPRAAFCGNVVDFRQILRRQGGYRSWRDGRYLVLFYHSQVAESSTMGICNGLTVSYPISALLGVNVNSRS